MSTRYYLVHWFGDVKKAESVLNISYETRLVDEEAFIPAPTKRRPHKKVWGKTGVVKSVEVPYVSVSDVADLGMVISAASNNFDVMVTRRDDKNYIYLDDVGGRFRQR